MAVVQISRIQVRRGQKNAGSGLPQLASGELGWAIDTRELYIGNGSVAEGSPAVGNTKILTQYDDIFSLADTYVYRADDAYIQTGSASSSPIQRSLQDRLDDIVSVRAFGLTGESSQNATAGLQRAIDQLFLNSATKASESSRTVLYIEAGIYTLTDTIYIPPHATIIGEGAESTVINQTANQAIFKTVNSTSTPGSPIIDVSSSTFNNQPQNIRLENFTLKTTQNNLGLWLQSCRNSYFSNIDIVGPWEQVDSINSSIVGIKIDCLSGSVESKNNIFKNITVSNWSYGCVSNFDIDNNTFDKCTFDTLGYGIAFGNDMILGSPGDGISVGPSKNIISNSIFNEINRQAIWVENGEYNISKTNKFTNCGNESGTEGQPQHSVIKFNKTGNESNGDYFSRTASLSYDQSYINGVPYLPEVEGNGLHVQAFNQTVSITAGSGTKLFRLPGNENQTIELEYLIVSDTVEMVRNGTLTIIQENSGTPVVHISDEYNYNGSLSPSYESAITFAATLSDENADLTNETINVNVTSTITAQMQFKIKSKKSNVI